MAAHPDHDQVGLALNNAATYLAEAGDIDRTLATRRRLIDLEPTGPFAQDQLARLGRGLEDLVDFAAAAHAYGTLRDAWLDDPSDRVSAEVVADAAHTAAVLLGALGDGPGAIAAYQAFVEGFSSDPRVPDARLSTARILGELGRHADSARAYADVVHHPGDASVPYVFFARLREADAWMDAGDTDRGLAAYADTAAAYRDHLAAGGEPGAHTAYVAEAMYRSVEPAFAAFADIELVGTEARVQRATADKVDRLQRLRSAYEEIRGLGATPHAVASLVRIGQANEEMARALRAAPCLERLTASQCRVARDKQEELAYLAEVRSTETYVAALDQAAALGVYLPETRAAADALRIRRPDRGSPAEQLPAPRPSIPDPGRRSYETTL